MSVTVDIEKLPAFRALVRTNRVFTNVGQCIYAHKGEWGQSGKHPMDQ